MDKDTYIEIGQYEDKRQKLEDKRRKLEEEFFNNEKIPNIEFHYQCLKMRKELEKLDRIINAAKNLERDIDDYKYLLRMEKTNVPEQERVELSELKEQLEEDIKDSFRILPEDLKSKTNIPENLRKIIINPQVTVHATSPIKNDSKEPVIKKEPPKTSKENQSLSDPKFDFNSLSLDELQHLYRQEAKKYQDNPELLPKLNDTYTKIKQQHKRESMYKYNDKGLQVFFDGKNIPKPRDRKVNETDEEYTYFLKKYYDNLEAKEVLNQPQPKNVSEDETEKDGKQLPIVSELPTEKQPPSIPSIPRPKANPSKHQEKGRTLDTIFAELKDGLIINKKSGKRYIASNIKVIKRFKSELKEKERIYNITNLLPAIGRVIIGTDSKYWSKWQRLG